MLQVEQIVGTSKLYGEIWKTMLRSPRARLTAIKYLEIKVPKNIDEAGTLNAAASATPLPHKKNCIYLSKYNMIITRGKMLVETCNFSNSSGNMPQWAQTELMMLELIRANTEKLERKLKE